MAESEAMADSKHLDFLQAVITRLAGNSFLVKGWSITLTTAIVGLAVKDGGGAFALVGLPAVAVFAMLDAYYLALERCFRHRFETAAATYAENRPADFNMASGFAAADFFKALVRPAVLLPHVMLAAVLVATWLLLCRAG
ncbi:MAG: hypothetical protein QOJ27_2779 [Sphingomonadales bacterium]|nr:hypothetical protein [Sphingomonadales bacterium]